MAYKALKLRTLGPTAVSSSSEDQDLQTLGAVLHFLLTAIIRI